MDPPPWPGVIAAARALMAHPRVEISDIEARIGTRYTAETMARRCSGFIPHVRFVWLMGADNLAQLHRWENWEADHGHGAHRRAGAARRCASRRARQRPHSSMPATACASAMPSVWPIAPLPAWAFVNMPDARRQLHRDPRPRRLVGRGPRFLAALVPARNPRVGGLVGSWGTAAGDARDFPNVGGIPRYEKWGFLRVPRTLLTGRKSGAVAQPICQGGPDGVWHRGFPRDWPSKAC
jgi:hypothetical protein